MDQDQAGPLLSVRDVTYTYREAAAPALRGVSFDLAPGELLVVMGASGAGKSTLCRCLNGIIPNFLHGALGGQVLALGRDTRETSVADCSRHVGLVFQDFEAQLFATNVELEVAFGAENLGVPRGEIRARVRDLLRMVGLSHLAARRPHSLSGGEKQRLAIAAALAAGPSVLVLDEATSDLDPVGKASVFGLARQLTTAAGRGVVFAHHDAEEAVRATTVLLLSEGRVAAVDTPARVLSQPDLLEANGVAPLAATSVFAALRLDERPLEDTDAAERLLARNLRIDGRAVARWEDSDRTRGSYGDPVIEVRGVTHAYGLGNAAIADIDLTIRRGEFVAIIGQNGSGKTTLVKHFNGLLRPTSGEVFIAGQPTRGHSLRTLAAQVGYVFQNPDHQIFAPNVFEEVAFGPRNFGLEEEEVRARVSESLAAVGLIGREEEDPFSLTKGERQRVAAASVLAGRPEVLIFDEPTTGLDDRESRSMMALIDQLNRRGHTIVVVTHSMWLAAEYARRVVVMQVGRITLDAPTRTAFSRREELRRTAIIPPQVVRLSQLLGGTALTVAELVEALR
jgi:energy-coupling factor transport system ATP-binding protein